MKFKMNLPLRWLAVFAFAAALGACGGGGGGSGGDGVTPPVPDARNGNYAMYAADAREYILSLDFDARTYRVTGNGQDVQGRFVARNAQRGEFEFDTDGTPIPPPGAPRFNTLTDAVVGSVRLPTGAVPFIAARSFATTFADAAGTYNFLASTRDAAAPSDSTIFSGEIVAAGTFRQCNHATIFTIAACPAASVGEYPLTISGNQFTATTPTNSYPFRVAKIGNERVVLRASAATATLRRFWVGMEAAPFVNDTFEGYNTNAQATATTLNGAYNATWSDATGSYVRAGTMGTAGLPSGLVGITSVGDGNFFAMANSSFFTLIAARGNPTWPGYVELGKR